MGPDRTQADGIWSTFTALPEGAQRLVEAYIARLARQYGPPAPDNESSERLSLAEEPFVGMWRDRVEMLDSTTWVRALRENEWARRRG